MYGSSNFDLYGGINGGGTSNGGGAHVSGGGTAGRYETTLFDRRPSYFSSLSSSTADYLTAGSGRGGGSTPTAASTTESAYDRYINDQLTSMRTSAYTTTSSNYGGNYNSDSGARKPSSYSSSSRRKYVFQPETDFISSKYSNSGAYGGSGSNNSAYGYNSSSGYGNSGSNSYSKSDALTSYTPSFRSSRFGAISSAPAFDKFGKELSNYERWKLSNTYEDTFNNNPSVTSSAINGNDATMRNNGTAAADNINEAQNLRRKRITQPRTSDDSALTPISASSALTFKDREFSVIPQSRSSFLDNNDDNDDHDNNYSRGRRLSPPVITGSRFTGKSTTPISGGRNRSSVEPASNGYLSSMNGSSSSNYGSKIVTSFPADVRSKLIGYDVRDVRGDGGCYYRCLSVYFTGSEDSYNKYRKEVMSYIKENEDSYKSMIKSEVGYASINDYFSRKTRSDRQEFAETTEIIATSCLYNINVHVLALVPGSRRSWEWLHFDPSIGSGKPSHATRDIHLYNQGSVHFMLCSPK